MVSKCSAGWTCYNSWPQSLGMNALVVFNIWMNIFAHTSLYVCRTFLRLFLEKHLCQSLAHLKCQWLLSNDSSKANTSANNIWDCLSLWDKQGLVLHLAGVFYRYIFWKEVRTSLVEPWEPFDPFAHMGVFTCPVFQPPPISIRACIHFQGYIDIFSNIYSWCIRKVRMNWPTLYPNQPIQMAYT